MKKLLHTWINNLSRPNPDVLSHGPDIQKDYRYPDTIDGEVLQKFTDLFLAAASDSDRYVNDSENWWNREEIWWQAGYRDAALDAIDNLRHLIDENSEPLDMTLIETLFPKRAS